MIRGLRLEEEMKNHDALSAVVQAESSLQGLLEDSEPQ